MQRSPVVDLTAVTNVPHLLGNAGDAGLSGGAQRRHPSRVPLRLSRLQESEGQDVSVVTAEPEEIWDCV